MFYVKRLFTNIKNIHVIIVFLKLLLFFKYIFMIKIKLLVQKNSNKI